MASAFLLASCELALPVIVDTSSCFSSVRGIALPKQSAIFLASMPGLTFATAWDCSLA